MKMYDAKINWYEGYANEPRLEIIVDEVPKLEDHLFDMIRTDRNDLYYSQRDDGHVSFFCHTHADERSYGGRTFKLNMRVGIRAIIRGPWSSRAGAMNRYFPHCVDVTLIDSKGTRVSGAVSVELAREAAEICDVDLVRTESNGDVVYRIRSREDDHAKSA